MSTFLIALTSWIVGFLSSFYLQNYQTCHDEVRLARVLLVEVQHNYSVSSQFAEWGQKFFGAELKSPMQKGDRGWASNPSLERIRVLAFRHTIFDATLKDHGLLPEKLLKDLHEFYWRLTEMDRLWQVVENEKTSLDGKQVYIRAFHHHAVAIIDLNRETGLLEAVKKESMREWSSCLKSVTF